MSESARVLVVGGGPGGLAAAGTLARAGLHAVVLEAGTYPRVKLCGEFLSPDAEVALASLGVRDLADVLGAPRIIAVRLTASSGGRLHADVSRALPVPGRGVAREDLDAALAEAVRRLGVEIHERSRVDRVHAAVDGVRADVGDRVHHAEALIVATGRPARPRGAAEGARVADRGWHGAKLHVRGPELPGVTELHFVPGAYVGLNEVACRGERVVNVCALATAAVWEGAGRSLDGLLEQIARESPAFAARRSAAREVDGSRAVAAAFDFDRRGASTGDARPALVIGDAAASIVPLTGDGQAMALAAGCSAGRVLAAARSASGALDADGARAAAREWERLFARENGVRLRVGRALQRGLLDPRGVRILLQTARVFGAVPRALYRWTRGPLGGATGPSAASRARSS